MTEIKDFKYTEVKIPIESVQDDGMWNDYAETDTKMISLHYTDYIDGKHYTDSREDFYLKQFADEWKIIDIRNKTGEE